MNPFNQVQKQEEDDVIFRSKLPEIHIPNHLPLHAYCFQNISQHKDHPCLIDAKNGHTYTYAYVELTSRKVASGLHKLGVQQGHVIMLLLRNSPQFVLAFLGASYRGAIATAANPFCNPMEIEKQAKASGAKLIITEAAFVHKVLDFALENDVMVMCIDAPPSGCLSFTVLSEANEDDDLPAVEICPDDVVALPYSSGTTGLPKGVMLTHKSLVTSVAQQVCGTFEVLNLRDYCKYLYVYSNFILHFQLIFKNIQIMYWLLKSQSITRRKKHNK